MAHHVVRSLIGALALVLIGIYANPTPLDARALVKLRGGGWCCDVDPNFGSCQPATTADCPALCPNNPPARTYIHSGTERKVVEVLNPCPPPQGGPVCAQPKAETVVLQTCPNPPPGAPQ